MTLHHLGDVAQRQVPLDPANRNRREIARCAERQHGPNFETLVGPVEEPAGARRRSLEIGQRRDELGVPGGVDDLAQLDVSGGQPRRIDLDLDLTVLLAKDGDVGHTGYARDAWLDDPPGEIRELDRAERRRSQPDQHHPSRCRHRLDQLRRLGDVGKRECVGQALLHQLARVERRGPGLEVQVDRRQARDGLRAHIPHVHDPVEQVVLERDGDVLLDLLAREPERLGLDFEHRAGGQLGHDVGGHVPQRERPENDHTESNAHQQHSEAQCSRQYRLQHPYVSLRGDLFEEMPLDIFASAPFVYEPLRDVLGYARGTFCAIAPTAGFRAIVHSAARRVGATRPNVAGGRC